MMNIDNKKLVEFYSYTDYIPVVSVATNLFDLFVKAVILPYKNHEEIQQNRYYTYLSNKETNRCLYLTLIPIMNLWIANVGCAIYDYYSSKYDDSEFMFNAFKRDEKSLKKLSLRLKNDQTFMFDVFKHKTSAHKYFGDLLKTNRDFLFECIKIDPSFYSIAHSYFSIIDDKDIALFVIDKDLSLFDSFSERLKKDKNVALSLLKKNGQSLEKMDSSIKLDRECVLAAVTHYGPAIHFAPAFQDDQEIRNAAAEQLKII